MSAPATDFDLWLASALEGDEDPGFTALIMLLRIRKQDVKPVASTFAHVIGAELDWGEMTALLNGSGRKWDAVALFPRRDPASGGPLDTPAARIWLADLEARIAEDRLVINEGRFFDAWGRAMRVDEVPL
ncbi:MAG: hypothetical protein U1E62_23920 [Alsobacter sp.]